jgi:hypothetical protein
LIAELFLSKMSAEILSTLGLTVGSRFVISVICEFIFNIRAVQKKKSELAYEDEQDVLTMATIATANFAYDNLNKVGASAVIVKISSYIMQASRGVQQDMVLPVLIWEKNFIDNMQADNSLSHKDKVKLFGIDFFNLGHYSNQEQRDHYIKVAHTVLARIAEELPGLQWVGQVLPKSHDHRHKGTASVKSSLHV